MLFNSYDFLFAFLPLTVAGFYLLDRWGAARLLLAWLLAASLVFYAWWNPACLPLLLASIGANYLLGRGLAQSGQSSVARKAMLAVGIAGNLGLLGYFKYAGFFAASVGELLHAPWQPPVVVLPLAISFFTFQQIAFLVDAYRGEAQPGSLLEYAVFVSFFPQLIAGPIVHHREMMPQIAGGRELAFRAEHISVGLTLLVIGLCKKVVLADNVSEYADTMFEQTVAGKAPTVLEAWIGVLAFTLEIYFDFSGYSDMALGLGRLFGLKLPLNFASPYKATSIVEFWRRWHITLSRFLRDYLYIPLGGNRRGKLRRYGNLMATMLLGGLWHGAGWTFVFWGGLHGVYLCLNHAWQRATRTWLPASWKRHPAYVAGCWLLTFLAVVAGWVFFRAPSFGTATTILASLVGLNGWELGPVCRTAIVIICIELAIVLGMPNSVQLLAHYEPTGDEPLPSEAVLPLLPWLRGVRWQPSWAMGMVMLVAATVGVLSMSRIREFVYFQF